MKDPRSLLLFYIGFILVIIGFGCLATLNAYLQAYVEDRGVTLGLAFISLFIGGILVGLGLMRDQMIKDYNLAPKTKPKIDRG